MQALQEIFLTTLTGDARWSLLDADTTRHAWSLFLDVDGTLLEIAETPESVCVDKSLLPLMADVQHALDGAVALVSGRPLHAIDELFAPLVWPAAGIHGLERRDAAGRIVRCQLPAGAMTAARDQLAQVASMTPGTLLEDKGCALALHYRAAPQREAALRLAAQEIVAALGPEYHVQEGKSVLEIKPVMSNKADAIRAFMREPPFAGRRPVFVGDDFTDLDGFAAVEAADGISISVGDRIDGQVRLASPRDVRALLARLAAGQLTLP
jgi:trehalose 6-phosphate phosphatase